ncbi:hypothetical protein N2152v2_000687 [Parachlorella kessleri]
MLLLERVLTRLETTDGPPPLHQALLAQGISDLRPFSKTRDVLLSSDRVTKHVLPKMRELEKEGLSPSEARQLLQLGTCLACSFGNVFLPNLYFLRWVLAAAPTADRDQVPPGLTLLGGLCLREPDIAVRLLTLPAGRLEVVGWGLLRLVGGSRQEMAALLLQRPAALAVRGARDAGALRELKERCGLSSEQLLELLARHPRLLAVPGPKMAAVLAAAGDLAAAGAAAAAASPAATATAAEMAGEQGRMAVRDIVLAHPKWIMVPHVARVLRRLRPLVVGLGWSLGEVLLVARYGKRLRDLPDLESHLDSVVEVLRALLGQEQASCLARSSPRLLVQAVEERVRAAAGQEEHAQPLDRSDSWEASDEGDGSQLDECLGTYSCSGWGSHGSTQLPPWSGGYPQLSLSLKFNILSMQPQPGQPTFDLLATPSAWGAPPLPNHAGSVLVGDASANSLWHCPALHGGQPSPSARPLLARLTPATQQAAQALQEALGSLLGLSSEQMARLLKACPALLVAAPDELLATADAVVQLLGTAGARRAVASMPRLLRSPAGQVEQAVAASCEALQVDRVTAIQLLQACPVLLTLSADQLAAQVQQAVVLLGERLELPAGDVLRMLRVNVGDEQGALRVAAFGFPGIAEASPALLALDFTTPKLERKLAFIRQELRLPADLLMYLLQTPSAWKASLPRLASRLTFLRSQGCVDGSSSQPQLGGTPSLPPTAAEVVSQLPPKDLPRLLAATPATFQRWASTCLDWEVGREELAAWEKAWVASPEGQKWMAKRWDCSPL